MIPGDRILVTMPRSAPREGEYVEDRGSRARVLLDGDTETCVVLRERVRPVPVRVIDRVEAYRMTRAQFDTVVAHVAPRAVPKPPKPLRSAAYLAWVRKRPCCVCEAMAPNEAHHFGPRGMGEKTDDYRVVALCAHHHREFHDHGVCRGWSRERTEKIFVQAMVAALYEWLPAHGHDDDMDHVIVDALIAHLRESKT